MNNPYVYIAPTRLHTSWRKGTSPYGRYISGACHSLICYFQRLPRLLLALLTSLFILSTGYASAQCNSELVDAAIAQSGADAIYLREFKVKFGAGNAKNPVPVGKFNVFLKENSQYRFNIATSKESESTAILQLFDKGTLLASTYEPGINTPKSFFDIVATKTGNYQVLLSFRDGKAGCAVGIMSLIRDKSARNDTVPAAGKELEILYLGIENPLNIQSDKLLNDSMLLSIDNGEIIKKPDGLYYAVVQKEGLARVKVVVKSSDGRIKDEGSSDFLVKRIPMPVAGISGLRGGIISHNTLQTASQLDIDYPLDFEKFGFTLLSFQVSIGPNHEKTFRNYGKTFSPTLSNAFSGLSEDSKIVIDQILVRTPKGETLTLEPVGFIVR